MTALCRSRSKRYGKCGLRQHDDGPHAVRIGDNFWFGYERRTGKPLGYGRFEFVPLFPQPLGPWSAS